jgi:hypothetical protein
VGNFYLDVAIGFPASATVNRETMSPNPDYGGCNRCHGPGGTAGGDGD